MIKYHSIKIPKHNTLLCLSIDPALDNTGIYVESRNVKNGLIKGVFMDKTSIRRRMQTQDLNEYLKSLDEEYTFDVVVVENIMKKNILVLRISMHFIVYYSVQNICTLEVSSKLKGRLGYTKDQDIKEWSVSNAKELLIKRRDWDTLEKLNKFERKHDIADCINQLEATMIKLGYPATEENFDLPDIRSRIKKKFIRLATDLPNILIRKNKIVVSDMIDYFYFTEPKYKWGIFTDSEYYDILIENGWKHGTKGGNKSRFNSPYAYEISYNFKERLHRDFLCSWAVII